MRQGCAILCLLTLIIVTTPADVRAKALDGLRLESATTLNRGAWNFKTGIDFGSKATPGSTTLGTGGNTDLEVNTIRLPLELRYGLADQWEIGGDIVIESDDGTQIPAGISSTGTTQNWFNESGLSRIRLFGKWNFWNDLTLMPHLAFGGSNELYHGMDSFDLGLDFLYGPQLGAGRFNLNFGFLVKSGDAKPVDIAAAKVDYKSVFRYGVGYVYPYTDRFIGIVELSGNSATLKGGNSALEFDLGGRIGFSDRFFFSGFGGFGLGDGAANFSLNVGLDWLFGAVGDEMGRERTGRWQPKSQQSSKKPAKQEMAKKTEPSKKPYYEAPTKYEVPKKTETQPQMTMQKQQMPSIDVDKRIQDATAAFGRQDYATASAHYEAALQVRTNDPVLYYNYATCQFQLKNYKAAKTNYLNAVRLNPNDADSRLYLGYTHYYLNDQASAISEWKKVLEIDPTNQLARDNLNALGAN